MDHNLGCVKLLSAIKFLNHIALAMNRCNYPLLTVLFLLFSFYGNAQDRIQFLDGTVMPVQIHRMNSIDGYIYLTEKGTSNPKSYYIPTSEVHSVTISGFKQTLNPIDHTANLSRGTERKPNYANRLPAGSWRLSNSSGINRPVRNTQARIRTAWITLKNGLGRILGDFLGIKDGKMWYEIQDLQERKIESLALDLLDGVSLDNGIQMSFQPNYKAMGGQHAIRWANGEFQAAEKIEIRPDHVLILMAGRSDGFRTFSLKDVKEVLFDKISVSIRMVQAYTGRDRYNDTYESPYSPPPRDRDQSYSSYEPRDYPRTGSPYSTRPTSGSNFKSSSNRDNSSYWQDDRPYYDNGEDALATSAGRSSQSRPYSNSRFNDDIFVDATTRTSKALYSTEEISTALMSSGFWPPPKYSAKHEMPFYKISSSQSTLLDFEYYEDVAPTLGEIAQITENALEDNGYIDWVYFRAPAGFIIFSDVEKFDESGESFKGNKKLRFKPEEIGFFDLPGGEMVDVTFGKYIGRFRMLAMIVTNQSIDHSNQRIMQVRGQAQAILKNKSGEKNKEKLLGTDLNKSITKQHYLYFLVYEWNEEGFGEKAKFIDIKDSEAKRYFRASGIEDSLTKEFESLNRSYHSLSARRK